MESTDFAWALRLLKEGKRVARAGWNGKGMWLYKVWGTSATVYQSAVVIEPFIVMKTADEKYIPWLANQTDLLAEDWTEVN